MKRFLTVLLISFSLSGCAGMDKSILSGGLSLTASVQNPVTPEMLYGLENGLVIVVTGLNSYKQLCVDRAIPATCRTVIRRLQGFTREARPKLMQLRAFIRSNDQVNAILLFNEIRAVFDKAKAYAAANGV